MGGYSWEDNPGRIFSGGYSREDIPRRIFPDGYSREDFLRRIILGAYSREFIPGRIFLGGYSWEDIPRRIFPGGQFLGTAKFLFTHISTVDSLFWQKIPELSVKNSRVQCTRARNFSHVCLAVNFLKK